MSSRLFPFLYFIAIVLTTTCFSAAQELRTVALSDDIAPGAPSGASFRILELPVLNDSGAVSFRAKMTPFSGGVTGASDEGIWSEGNGTLSLVVREGFAAPGTPAGTNFGSNLGNPILGDSGAIAFLGNLLVGSGDTSDSSNEGIWFGSSGALGLVAREGSQAPGTTVGALFGAFPPEYSPVLNNAGHTAFLGTLQLSGGGVTLDDDSGIWSGTSATLDLIAREGSQAPGAANGVNFGSFNKSPVLNSVNQLAFLGQLTGESVTDSNDTGIWAQSAGTLNLVAREGSQAPGTASDVNFGDFQNAPVINNQGQTAFWTSLALGGSVTSTDDEGIWTEGSGSLQLLVRESDAAPGTPSEVVFRSFESPLLNDLGNTAFVGYLRPGHGGVDANNKSGIWSDAGGELELLAREGSQAPDTPDGANFGNFSFATSVLNGRGQTAFVGVLQTGVGGVTSENDRGIWAQDTSGTLHLVVREGDSLEIAEGDSRTVSRLDFVGDTGNEDGRGSGFNDLGQLVFRAIFTDNSYGIFVSDRVAFNPADFNRNGAVDGDDLIAWQDAFGNGSEADANGDGVSDGKDFLAWQRQYGEGVSAVSAIPEPETLALILSVCLGLGARKNVLQSLSQVRTERV